MHTDVDAALVDLEVSNFHEVYVPMLIHCTAICHCVCGNYADKSEAIIIICFIFEASCQNFCNLGEFFPFQTSRLDFNSGLNLHNPVSLIAIIHCKSAMPFLFLRVKCF